MDYRDDNQKFNEMNTLLLYLLSLGAIVSGIFVIAYINPILSVLCLICVFVNVACYLVFTLFLINTYPTVRKLQRLTIGDDDLL